MEEFFQYIGPDGGAATSSALLNRERMFVYSSPREKQIDRCGELRVGSYFACSSVLYYEDQVWLKIRRGYFSNAKNNGYIRVQFELPTGSKTIDGSDLPTRQISSAVTAQPAPFRYMRRLPEFPTYMCARDRLVLYREPVFNLHSASVSSSSSGASSNTPQHMQRFLPPVSVFQATECRFNQDFTQLAVKVTSALAGLGGWINASFHKSLIEVEDPKQVGYFRNGPVYLQNVAGRGGKWAGELPVRAIPSLQAPRLYNVESYRVVRAIERKLLKDRVWVRIQPLKSQQELQQGGEKKSEEENPAEEAGENQDQEHETAGPDAWVIERNANTAQRVMVPWGSNRIQDVPANDNAERYYRTVYSRRPLPLRRTADLQAEIVGHLEPGSVFSSTQRVLNDKGRMWIRVAIPSEKHTSFSKNVDEHEDNNTSPDNNAEEAKEEEEEFEDLGKSVRYGYAIQSNAKTNTCMVQEIPPPGKMNPKQYYQVSLSDDGLPQNSNQDDGTTAPENTIAARAEASNSAKELFYVKNGAIVSAVGTVFNAEQGRMWLQVLAIELDPAMRVKHQWPLSDAEQKLNVVYLPMCGNSHETVLKPVHRELARIDNPQKAEKDNARSPSRVVFSGRASKLFGSHLLRPSTIDLPSTFPKKDKASGTLSSGINVSDPVARAAGGNDHTQSLKDEITAWQLQTGTRVTQLYTQIGALASYTLSCVRRPFTSCLAHQEAKRRYRQLDQDEEGMEEYALDDDDVRV
ncbi:uncharacterized protein PITG_11451 [Phytophthora infestans T30-4]|uniref:Uncharacterized protein n=2 Tax=Phytophthora infestans TaxID=4787 RepID=D0NIT4_PHYIT|nr:uncharacterized protein PITG_11451 [Phytophthora infestans T30-4]EEY59418.1 conserved hypothetical protein [Phytophthora infestans T30-4]KAF4039602.1 hypothetical protein GN244_ATG08247 [Phytophthora infestans]KAF4138658.1 hypothetical protein GN958_ATG12163 [Phytophthora infestans]KAI9980738.1 hypothetical protein PInf_010057 [Phytophthora infestans]|eukprot:XP_002901028.1 conserved hypothetical protein [Phytophthora infestans T30-4]